MGNRTKIVASITGAAALIVAPFIHSAFSAAASDPVTDNSSKTSVSTTQSSAQEPTTNSTDTHSSSDESATGADNDKDKGTMPVSVTTETINGETSMTVNGQPVDVPDNGTVHKTIEGNSSTTTVTINNDGGNGTTTTRTSGGTTRTTSRTSSNVKVTTRVRDTETTH